MATNQAPGTTSGAPLDHGDDRPWDCSQTAGYLGITEFLLAQMRYNGTGPKFLKLSHKVVRYRRSDVDAWLDSIARTQTGEA